MMAHAGRAARVRSIVSPVVNNPIYRGAVARAGVVPITGICALASAALMIKSLGIAEYGIVATLVALPAMLPFLDLGLGASLTTTTAQEATNGSVSLRMIGTLRRVLVVSSCIAVVLLALALPVVFLTSWPHVFGWESHSPLVRACLAIVVAATALALPASVGARLLLGLNRNDLAVAGQALGTVVSTVLVALCFVSGASGVAYCAALASGPLAGALICSSIARRRLKITWRTVTSRSARATTPDRLRATAGPMLLIIVSVALAYQSDRLVIAAVTGGQSDDLATYSAAVQIYGPVFAALLAGMQALWPTFVKSRTEGGPSLTVTEAFRPSLTLWAVLAALLVLGGSPAVLLISDGQINATPLLLTMAALLLAHAFFLPFGMNMIEGPALRFQAVCHGVMLPVNLGLSLVLVHPWGAAGPVLGSLVAITVCMTIPAALYSRRRTSAVPGRMT